MANYYDYESVGRDAGLSPEQISALVARWQEDYPNDPMMLELRLLRTCFAIQGGHCTFQQAMERESIPRMFTRPEMPS